MRRQDREPVIRIIEISTINGASELVRLIRGNLRKVTRKRYNKIFDGADGETRTPTPFGTRT